jgi:hypothetical protein
VTTEAEQIAQLMKRSKISMSVLLDALSSEQSTFAAVDEPADSGLPFITRLVDSPIQVTGRLGLDGVWRLSTCVVSVAAEHEADAEINAADSIDEDLFVIVDGIDERMIKFVIPRVVADEAMADEVRAVLLRRLAASRFGSTIH